MNTSITQLSVKAIQAKLVTNLARNKGKKLVPHFQKTMSDFISHCYDGTMHLAFRITEAFHRNKKPNPSLISVYCTGGFSIGFNTQCCLTVVNCCTLFVTTMHRHFTHILLLKNDSTDFCCV